MCISDSGQCLFPACSHKKNPDASQAAFQADVREELRSVRTALDRDYLLREPHMQEHGLIKDRLSRHDSRLNALEARVDRWERKA